MMFASRTAQFFTPIPISDIESVLSWVDNFKLSRPTKKIHRDFSDAVLLAEILYLYYPKIVEMHNYPPRNSSALKLNNWMTLNRKVLRKLKLHLCNETMEQLANCTPGIIERILILVRDKIRKDEEANKSINEEEMSSGGSYYEACDDEDNVLVVPVKSRINGVMEMVQQKVVTYNAHIVLKEELKDAREAIEVLKQKVNHLEELMKLKEERVDELQKQLDRKAIRRKESESLLIGDTIPVTSKHSLPLSPTTSDVTIHNLSKSFASYTKIIDKQNNIIPFASKESSVFGDIIDKKDSNNTVIFESKENLIINLDQNLIIEDAINAKNPTTFNNSKEGLLNIDKMKNRIIDEANNEKHELKLGDPKENIVKNRIIEEAKVQSKFNVSKANENFGVKEVKSELWNQLDLKESEEDFEDSLQDLITVEQTVQNEVIEIINIFDDVAT